MAAPKIPAKPETIVLEMRLLDYDGKPFANHAVDLKWGTRKLALKTRADGVLVTLKDGPVRVAAAIKKGELQVKAAAPPAPKDAPTLLTVPVVVTKFGGAHEDAGRLARVNNLGYGVFDEAAFKDKDAGTNGFSGGLYSFARANAMPFLSASAQEKDAIERRLEDAHDTPNGALVKP